MFETIINLFSAWNALLYLLAGGTILGLGLLVVGYAAYVRFAERCYQGQIVGVRSDAPGKQMYWPLIAYTDDAGTRHEVLANSGSSLIGGRAPGTKVTIFAAGAAPRAVMLLRDLWLLLILGLFLAAVGTPLLAVGISMLRLNAATGLVALGLAFYAGFHLFRLFHPLLDARKAGGWQAAREAFAARLASKQPSVVVSAADIAAATATQSKSASVAQPVLLLVGAALLIGGGIWFDRQVAFLHAAVEASGVVLRNEESDDADSNTSYHPVIAFTDRRGEQATFRDSVGTSPPMYATGDKVKVFYAPNNSSHAELDRGIWNWLVPLLLAAAGALLSAFAGYNLVTRPTAARTQTGVATS